MVSLAKIKFSLCTHRATIPVRKYITRVAAVTVIRILCHYIP